jgi:hypothetical protein
LTSAQFSDEFDSYKDQYTPVDFEGYSTGDGLRFSVIWVESCGLGWALRRNLSSADMATDFATYRNQGLRVAKVTSYRHQGVQYYAAIWLENASGRNWAELRDMTGAEFSDAWDNLRDDGYRLADFAAYETGNGVRFAGVWREND